MYDSHKLDLILIARFILVGFHLSATSSNLCPFIGSPEAIALFTLKKPLFLLLYSLNLQYKPDDLNSILGTHSQRRELF